MLEDIQQKIAILRCPSCGGKITIISPHFLECENCNQKFLVLAENAATLLSSESLSNTKADIQGFWGDMYRQWYSALDTNLDAKTLQKNLEYLLDMFLHRKHLAVIEVKLNEISGMNILEIGSGGGAHSALFKKNGADVVAVDITPERVISTANKLSIVPFGKGVAFLADAEKLPFNNESFDIVYSNGVLHHSENTEKCIDEVYRVLKPSGKAIIMLYSRHSAMYWTRWFVYGLLCGNIFRFPEAEWFGRITEGRPKFGQIRNPITRVYSKRELCKLFRNFKIISLRKNSFLFTQIPLLNKARDLLMKAFGYKPHPGGVIVYGSPFVPESKLELALGPYIGFSWNILAQKEA